MLLGRDNDCLNACVAAATSQRVLTIADALAPRLAGATALVATGSDDLIEGESCDDFEHRLKLLLERLHAAGVITTFLATLPPRTAARENCHIWSERIRRVAQDTGSGLLDFHDWLADHAATCMVRGEYPGAAGQALLALRVAEALGVPPARDAPDGTYPPATSAASLTHLARKLARRLEPWTSNFPGEPY
jgi:hypothetical protein